MPRTKPKPESQTTVSPPPETNGPSSERFTLPEAAAYLRLPEADVVRMITEQDLPARQVGTEWRFLKLAIQRWLSTGSALIKGSKAAWLSLAGSCRDDPDLEGIVEETYRKRGRPITEDGSYKNFSR